MINPSAITNFNLSKFKLEEMILFWIFAAGKNATTSARGLDKFLKEARSAGGRSPFDCVRKIGLKHLPLVLKGHGIGCYNQKAKTIYDLATSGINLRTCTTDDLEKIKGIGLKTSRCFLIHSRQDAQYAGLDTHLLKYLKDQGYDVPKSTPTKRRYLELEKIILEMAKRADQSVSEFDLNVWKKYSGR